MRSAIDELLRKHAIRKVCVCVCVCLLACSHASTHTIT